MYTIVSRLLAEIQLLGWRVYVIEGLTLCNTHIYIYVTYSPTVSIT